MSWYRQYRPHTISELHATSVRQQLEQLRKSSSFPHAVLLVGPRGAGKTSTARILAAMLNNPKHKEGEPLTDPDPNDDLIKRIHQGNSLAVQEMDAASHRGIDDIRALKEQAYLPPQEGRTLVFILDEVHMLTTEAFNALLKLLEEPPSHVVFILATTEEQKMPETIVSRCTVVRFRHATPAEVTDALQDIIKDQKISIEPEALTAISLAARGSFRDGVKYLEAVSTGKQKITLEDMQILLGSVPGDQLTTLIDFIISKQEKAVVRFFTGLREKGANQASFTRELIQYLHQDLVAAITAERPAKYAQKVSHYLLAQLSAIDPNDPAPIPFLQLELRALEIILKAQEQRSSGSSSSKPPTNTPSPRSTSSPSAPPSSTMAPSSMTSSSPIKEVSSSSLPVSVLQDVVPSPSFAEAETIINSAHPETAQRLIQDWARFVQQVELFNSSLAAVLRTARCSCTQTGKLKVEVFYTFHRDQLEQPKFNQLVHQVGQDVAGGMVQFEFAVAENAQVSDTLSNVSLPASENEQLVQLAQEVFM